MFNKFLLVPAVLSIAGLLTAADTAFAQRSGGGHSSGGRSSGGHSSGGHSGGHVSGGHSGSGHYSGGHYGGGHYGGGYNHGYSYGRGGYNHGFYGGYYPGIFGGYYPYDDYAYPRYSYYYNAPAVEYYTPPTQYYAPPAQVTADVANIRVIVPDPQARVWFDGNATSQAGTDRLFHTPTLTMGSTYSYQIRASWMQGGREVSQDRTVSVTPGQTSMVDFSR